MGEIQDGTAVFAVQDKRMQALVDMFYPVGIVIAVANDNTPAFTKYGTWSKIGSGRVLWGADSSHKAGTTIEAGLPNIKGSFDHWKGFTFGDGADYTGALYREQGKHRGNSANEYGKGTNILFDASKSNDIYGKSTTVQPPAYVVTFWKRTA